jgi:hypothetical protein
VRSDKHLKKLKDFLLKKIRSTQKNEIISSVVSTGDNICRKNFDIVWKNQQGRHAIELKSINGSASKNINNRIEEMIGQSFNAKEIYGLRTFSYVFVDNCSLKNEIRERLFIHASKVIQSGYLDRISIFQTHNSDFYKTKSFECWNFN